MMRASLPPVAAPGTASSGKFRCLLLVALAAAAAAGCSRTTAFSKPGATAEELNADRAQCEAMAAAVSPMPLAPGSLDQAELQPGSSAPQVLMDRSSGETLASTPNPANQPYYDASLGSEFAHFLAVRSARARAKHILAECMASKGWLASSS
jgi:hypothetical protein